MAAADVAQGPEGAQRAADGPPGTFRNAEDLIDACLKIVGEGVGSAMAQVHADFAARFEAIDNRLARLDAILIRLEMADEYRTHLARSAAGLHPH